jgi:hypothetical protein
MFQVSFTARNRALRAIGVLGAAAIAWLAGAYVWVQRSPGESQTGALLMAFLVFTSLCIGLFFRSGIGPGSVAVLSILGFAFGSMFVPVYSMGRARRIAELAQDPMARFDVEYPILIAAALVMIRLGFQRTRREVGPKSPAEPPT